MDEEISRLEELAALGDPEAIKKLRQMRRKISAKPKKFFHCLTWNQIWKSLGFKYEDYDDRLMDYTADLVSEILVELRGENGWNSDIEDKCRDKLYQICSNNLFKKVISATQSVVEDIVEEINSWGHRGVQSAIYERERHKTGIAVELFPVKSNHGETINLDQSAFCFKLYRPFLGVYTEAAYCVTSIGDEGYKLFDMKGSDVINVGKWISECVGDTSPHHKLMDQLNDIDSSPSFYQMRKIKEEVEKEIAEDS